MGLKKAKLISAHIFAWPTDRFVMLCSKQIVARNKANQKAKESFGKAKPILKPCNVRFEFALFKPN